MALGAKQGELTRLFLMQALRLTAIGAACGLAVAFLLARLMTKLLFNVAPNDPLTLVGVSVLLAGTSVIAALLPARRAARVDPAIALRAD